MGVKSSGIYKRPDRMIKKAIISGGVFMMKKMIVGSKLLLAVMFLFTSLALAVEPPVRLPGALSTPNGIKSTLGATDAKTAVKNKIDINTASEADLKSISGIGSAYAPKIIAARPYANKAQLKSRNVLPVPVYEQVKDLIIAKQPVKEAPEKTK
jgi:DNA uptake protein ComE-like DNA-binding protein